MMHDFAKVFPRFCEFNDACKVDIKDGILHSSKYVPFWSWAWNVLKVFLGYMALFTVMW